MNNKTKRLLSLIPAAVLAVALTACGSTAQSTNSVAETAAPAAETAAPATPTPAVQTPAPVALGQVTTYKLETKDGLLTIELPNTNWYELQSDENTEMFSDGDCAILVNLYKSTDTIPNIATVDATHPLVYNATVSSGDYLLHVVGYATAESDFSDICKSINTINLNLEKITPAMLSHTVDTTAYSIRECNYTAWVNASTLHVRASSAEDSSIVASLSRNEKLTVTGTVLKNGTENGWSRVKLANGTEGYVSTQFLTTRDPQTSSITQTGSTMTLYNIDNAAVTLYSYSDGTWRDAYGVIYYAYTGDTWKNYNGDYFYTYKLQAYKTGVSFPLYYSNGASVMVYEYSDDTYRDDYGSYYHKYNAGQWQCSDGTILDLEYNYEPDEPYRTGVCFPLYYSWGDVVYVYEYSDDTYRDDYDNYYYKYNAGQWQCDDGTILDLEYNYDDYDYDSYDYDSYDNDSDSDYESDEAYQTGVSFPVYSQYGAVVYIYEYSDGTYRDESGITYHKYNAGQWQSSTGELYDLEG